MANIVTKVSDIWDIYGIVVTLLLEKDQNLLSKRSVFYNKFGQLDRLKRSIRIFDVLENYLNSIFITTLLYKL